MSDYAKAPKKQRGDKWVGGPAAKFVYEDAGGRPVLREARVSDPR